MTPAARTTDRWCRSRRLAAVATLAGSLACVRPEPAPPNPVPPELQALYAAIHENRRDYENGLRLVVLGQRIAGENMMAAATDRIAVVARLCARTPGCDARLFDDSLWHQFEERTLPLQPRLPEAALGDDHPHPSADGAVLDRAARAALLHEVDLRELIPRNRQVEAALNDWLTWSRPALMDAYENYQFLRDKVAPIYADEGLPEALLFAMMAEESGAKVHAYSRAGAAGPLQFMPLTARRYGLGSVGGFDMRLDPMAATRANAAYLHDQFEVFDDDLEKTLAAYNVGESKLRRLDRKYAGADFWDARIYYAVPYETRKYVPRVLAAMLIFIDPERHGIRFPEIEGGVSRIELLDAISLGELAVCLGQRRGANGWFRTLRNLNPRVDPADRVPGGATLEMPSMLVPVYTESCTGHSPLLSLARTLHDADYPAKPDVTRYTVRRGDTLAVIAERHGCASVEPLVSINGLRGPEARLRVGQRLAVPACG